MSTRRFQFLVTFAFVIVTAILIAIPATALAQHPAARGGGPHGGPRVHVSVGVGIGCCYPGYGVYNPWIGFYGAWGPWGGPWGPYGGFYPYGFWGWPYPPYGYYGGYYGYDGYVSSLKFQVKQKDAEVYVNGSIAGRIDDFDGLFQSLKLKPGGNEIVVYRDGFRSAREQVYIEPYGDRKLKFDLEPLKPGETQEPRPTPAVETEERDVRVDPRMDPYRADPRGRAPRPGEPEPQRVEPQRVEPYRDDTQTRFGTLSLRVQPFDAEVLVDGERWAGAGENQRLTIKLASGRHRVEVRKDGFTSYAEDVLIRDGATMTLNVGLTKK